MKNKNLPKIPNNLQEDKEILDEFMQDQIYSLSLEEYTSMKKKLIKSILTSTDKLKELRQLIDEELAESKRDNSDNVNIASLMSTGLTSTLGVAITNLTLFGPIVNNSQPDIQSLIVSLMGVLTILESIPLTTIAYNHYVNRTIPRTYHALKAKHLLKSLIKVRKDLYIQHFLLKEMSAHEKKSKTLNLDNSAQFEKE